MRILVVEDDRKVATFIQRGLEEEGYAVDVLHDGAVAGEQAHCIEYDAAVLDLMLPGRSGFQVLRDIRAEKAELPVLILTAKSSLEERVTGLDSGADDYMVKPFALAEAPRASRAALHISRSARVRRTSRYLRRANAPATDSAFEQPGRARRRRALPGSGRSPSGSA
jgi:two-component system OmpR family response regulator